MAAVTSDAQQLRSTLAQRTGTNAEDWFVVYRARHGLQLAFEAVRAPDRTSVITQLLTCATAVNPILTAGLRPLYAEIDPDTLAIDPDTLAVAGGCAAVVIQHTFGIVDQSAAAATAARARAAGAAVIEDSAHTVGTIARDADGKPLADVSVHSFGAEKMLATSFGAAVWVSPQWADDEARQRLVRALTLLPAMGWRLRALTRAYRTQLGVLRRIPGSIGSSLQAGLTRTGLFEPPIAPRERAGANAHRPMLPSARILAVANESLSDLAQVRERRAAAVDVYTERLTGRVQIPAAARGALVRFPLLVASTGQAEALVSDLGRRGYFAGRWYRPALFPGVVDPGVYGYAQGAPQHRVTEDVIARIVNLPTNVSPQVAAKISDAVLEFLDRAGSSET